MDDEEEDMSRPISQHWGTPFRDVKYEDRPIRITAGQAHTGLTAALPTLQSHNNNSINPCSLDRQPHLPFHGNAGLRSHFPAQFEPMEDRGERQVEVEEGEGREEDDHRMAQRPEEQGSVEVQIGRKLREIGDKFQEDHLELALRHQRENLPIWMRLTMAVFGFLFPREVFIPRLREEQR